MHLDEHPIDRDRAFPGSTTDQRRPRTLAATQPVESGKPDRRGPSMLGARGAEGSQLVDGPRAGFSVQVGFDDPVRHPTRAASNLPGLQTRAVKNISLTCIDRI
ncbi:MAG: hypothetical protein ABIR68_07005 [Ilumatobacteraceae bacterium]